MGKEKEMGGEVLKIRDKISHSRLLLDLPHPCPQFVPPNVLLVLLCAHNLPPEPAYLLLCKLLAVAAGLQYGCCLAVVIQKWPAMCKMCHCRKSNDRIRPQDAANWYSLLW